MTYPMSSSYTYVFDDRSLFRNSIVITFKTSKVSMKTTILNELRVVVKYKLNLCDAIR